MRALPIIITLCLLTACDDDSKPTASSSLSSNSASSSEVGWTHGLQLTVDGRTRTYALYVPTTGQSSGLMVVLHGSGQTVENMISEAKVESAAEAEGIIVAVPSGIDEGWNDEDPPGESLADDVGFIDALVVEIKASYPAVPDEKVFAHGFSNGGGLATRLACESDHIRGIGVVGNYYVGVFAACSEARDFTIPGWFGAGLEDDLVPVESVRTAMSSYAADLTTCSDTGALQTIEMAGESGDVVCKQFPNCDGVRLCEYAGRGHEVLPGSFDAAWHFLSQRGESGLN